MTISIPSSIGFVIGLAISALVLYFGYLHSKIDRLSGMVNFLSNGHVSNHNMIFRLHQKTDILSAKVAHMSDRDMEVNETAEQVADPSKEDVPEGLKDSEELEELK